MKIKKVETHIVAVFWLVDSAHVLGKRMVERDKSVETLVGGPQTQQ